jgi:hypothetical protein
LKGILGSWPLSYLSLSHPGHKVNGFATFSCHDVLSPQQEAQKQWCQPTMDWNLQNCEPKKTLLHKLVSSSICYISGKLT